ncbi:MAG TPA: hypothetical protein VE173_11900, partial [Longimicrobiales bacterium]|nr:hypothetical protein [Longimicrobiales bacterium]
IAGGVPVTVVVDSVSGRVWLDVPPALGEEEWEEEATGFAGPAGPAVAPSLGLPATVTLMVPAARTRFDFAPGGQAFGGYVALDSPLGSRVITLDRWTGDVVVH